MAAPRPALVRRRAFPLVRACAAGLVLATALGAGPAAAQAQASARLSGRLLDSFSGDPIPGAIVWLDELRRETVSAGDGTFSFDGVPPGLPPDGEGGRLLVAPRRRSTVTVRRRAGDAADRSGAPLRGSGVGGRRGAQSVRFAAAHVGAVGAGAQRSSSGRRSAQTLENQAGVTARSFGPAPARPVIRGLDGDRVLILQDGQRMGDLSSQSGDHGVTINPAAGAAHRSRARAGDAALRRQRDRRPRQRHHQRHPDARR